MGESSVAASKRLKLTDTDMITNMPQSIISHILSLLPTKDVVRTCVLSKDWEYKWTLIYNIDIDDRQQIAGKRTRKKSLIEFIDRTLLLSQHSTIKTFRLSFSQMYGPDLITKWMSAILLRHVENVEISYNHEGGTLPRCLFHCKSLAKLEIRMSCTLRIQVQNWFSNLKILYLLDVKIENGFVSDASEFTLHFPVLETIELNFCSWWRMNFVDIKAPALTKFYVTNNAVFPEVEERRIKISGAKQLEFNFYSNFAEFFDLSTSSISSATIDFPPDLFGDRAIEENGLPFRILLKRSFLGLNHLKVAGEIVEAVTKSTQGPSLPRFNVLKRIEVHRKCSSIAFLEFLHAMPVLECVIIDIKAWDDYDYDEVESVPLCILSHLNEVQFVGYKGKRQHVSMANFLLTNAVLLRKMLGLSRNKSKERKIEKNFWTKLKIRFIEGDFEVGPSIKTIADFELLFG